MVTFSIVIFVLIFTTTAAQEKHDFRKEFYQTIADLDPGRSLVVCPLPAGMALAFVGLGAEGDTLAELNETLGYSSKQNIKEAYRAAREILKTAKGVTFSIADKVFVKKGQEYTLSALYKKDTRDVFQTEAENVDFTQSAEAAHSINSWVANNTNDKIKNTISPDSLDEETRLVLVNAVYFKGRLSSKFPEESTAKRDFFVSATKKTE